MTRSLRSLTRAVTASVIPFLLLACNDDAGDDPGRDSGGTISCRDNPRGLEYSANLEKAGKTHTFVLMSADPAPPQQGQNVWTLRLLDNAGQPVSGASLQVTPFMPDHGHGAPLAPHVTDNGDGTYRIERVILQMAGLWETTITATVDGAKDEAVFPFCIGE